MKSLSSKNKEIIICILAIAVFSLAFICVLIFSSLNQNSVDNTQQSSANSTDAINESSQNSKKTIMILATGGTIAGSGENGKQTGYKPGAISADDLINSVPKLKDVANIKTEQICNLNSDDLSEKEWLEIAKRLNELEKDPSIDGMVVTHGTDTMEETSYFMNLVCKTTKPVVFTGSMRPATALSADGPMNLYQAVLTATKDYSKNMPVMTVMDDTILSSRVFQKISTSSLGTMQSMDVGQLGIVRDDKVYITDSAKDEKYTTKTPFSIDNVDHLPKVSIVYFNIDADVKYLKNVIDTSDGVVIAGAGAGEYSEKFKEVIDNAKIPVVISTRCSTGIINQDSLLSKNSIASLYLNPQKAAVLLKVALIGGKNPSHDELVNIFRNY